MLLDVQNIQKTFETADGQFEVLRGIDMKLDTGQTLALTGESGSGKSTLLHLIGGLDAPNGGKILLEGQDVSRLNDTERSLLRREKIGVVFQQFNLIPSLRVRDNIVFQARLAGRYDAEWADTLARRLGLLEQLKKYPENLSGGQQQRVAIARTLAVKPKLVLADEPTGNLDEASASAVMTLFLELVSDTGAALLTVTHSEKIAAQHQKRLHLAAGRVA